MDYLNVLQRLGTCHGPGGEETQVAAVLQDLVEPYVESCTVDTLGNLIVHRPGPGQRVMLCANMDTRGLVVTHIEESGFLRVGRVGNLPLRRVLYDTFRFKNGLCGQLVPGEGSKGETPSADNLYLDIGARNRAEAERMVHLGDSAVIYRQSYSAGDRLIAPGLDNRLGCLVLFEALSLLQKQENDLYVVFSVQQVLGQRGIRPAAFAIDPAWAVTVSLTPGDEPESKAENSCRLGGGVGIQMLEGNAVAHPQVVEHLLKLAAAQGIAHQRDIAPGEQGELSALPAVRSGVRAGGITIPCRYLGSGGEMADTRDVKAAARLAAAFAAGRLPLAGKQEV